MLPINVIEMSSYLIGTVQTWCHRHNYSDMIPYKETAIYGSPHSCC